jgi:hypothetical protein
MHVLPWAWWPWWLEACWAWGFMTVTVCRTFAKDHPAQMIFITTSIGHILILLSVLTPRVLHYYNSASLYLGFWMGCSPWQNLARKIGYMSCTRRWVVNDLLIIYWAHNTSRLRILVPQWNESPLWFIVKSHDNFHLAPVPIANICMYMYTYIRKCMQ